MEMMSINSSKRKGRLNPNSSKLGKSKFYPPEKNMSPDGIYSNSKLMYTAASLVGSVVQIQVQNGAIFEGVLRTFSPQLDIVLETAHKVKGCCGGNKNKGLSPTVSNLIASYPFEGGIFDKLIFKLSDIILMVASTVDMDYAVKDNFTDTAISKFNGQVKERELEPWEDVDSDWEEIRFSIEDDDGTNGWDANDMFRTNAEKYGVKSSYDNSLQDYTVPLTTKDTEEYKLQEAKALKIAQEIETNTSYQSRIQLENGDEEDRFSAVLREEPSKNVLTQKRRNASLLKRVSSKQCVIPNQNVPYSSSLPVLDTSVTAPTVPKTVKCPPADILSANEECVSENPPLKIHYSTLPPRIERKREKYARHKGRTDEIEEFKKFSSNFKLTDEKELHEVAEMPECRVLDALASQIERTRIEEDTSSNNIVKFSTLNPNAKEFVFNPNAKVFTPRSMSVVTPPVQQDLSMMMPPPQPLFTAVPQYVMQAAPVSVAITSPYATGATPVPQQPPRLRKGAGQALLAPSVAPSQLTVQYSSAPGVLPAPTQTAVAYPQMNFVVGPRVVSPQPMGVIPTSHSVSYCDTSHLPTHLIMSTHPAASHTAVTTPHNPPPQTPPPPHCQPPTLSTMYPPGHYTGHHSQTPTNQTLHHIPPPHQQVVLMQQQQPVHHSLHLVHHSQAGTHLLPQMAFFPTSAALSSAPTPSPYMQQHP